MEAPKSFLSYSRADSEFALKLATDLRSAGANIWIDQLDIGAGEIWDLEIEKALANCQSIMAILSCSSVASNNVLNEIYYALEEGKKVLPIIIDECKIPFRIKRLQHIDIRKNYDQGLSRILKALNITQKSVESSMPAVSPQSFSDDASRRDEFAWKQAQKEDSINSYRDYIKNFPQGKFLNEAADAINVLKRKEIPATLLEADDTIQTVQENRYNENETRTRKKSLSTWLFVAAGIAIIAVIGFFIFNKQPAVPLQSQMLFPIGGCDTMDASNKLACYIQLAEKGNDTAMLIVASMYDRGEGTAVNDSAAFTWYSKAADAGNVKAMYAIGDFYVTGRAGHNRDSTTALAWFTKAADKGFIDATERLKQFQQIPIADTGKKNEVIDSSLISKPPAKQDTVIVVKAEKKEELEDSNPTTPENSNEYRRGWFVSAVKKGQVQNGNEFDFETGKQTATNSDFYFKGRLILLRKHNSSFSIVRDKEFEGINIPYLASLSYSRDILTEQQLSPGMIIAVKTHEGGYAKFRVEAFGPPLRISWVTYYKRRKDL